MANRILAPMMEAVEYEDVTFANDFNQPSIYRGYPTPEREKAWEGLWKHGTIDVPEDKLSALNYSTSVDYMRTPAEEGGGIEATVEIFHQLHCLNMIRQYIYLDEYSSPPPGFSVPKMKLRTHIDHCIETLRLALMCAGDITPMPIRADSEAPGGARAEFSTTHRCRKWDRIVGWMERCEIRGSDGYSG